MFSYYFETHIHQDSTPICFCSNIFDVYQATIFLTTKLICEHSVRLHLRHSPCTPAFVKRAFYSKCRGDYHPKWPGRSHPDTTDFRSPSGRRSQNFAEFFVGMPMFLNQTSLIIILKSKARKYQTRNGDSAAADDLLCCPSCARS